MSEPDHGDVPAVSAPIVLPYGRHAPDEPPPLDPSSNLDTVETETRYYRHDGWTPAARASFLDMLAKSGIVTDACREVQRSSQAAYVLRNRDALFAAGWDAALSMSRARLADELYHRAINGTVDQIWKDGEIVAERHRHDNRLSIAVLNRLDARCDRAERIGAPTQRIAAEWDFYLAALAEDRTADAQALLDPPLLDPPPPAPLAPTAAIFGQGSDAMLIHQLHQLRSGHALDEEAVMAAHEDEDEERVWVENECWRTNFPPPADFHGAEEGDYGDEDYNRQCTLEESAVLDRRFPDTFDDADDDRLEADEAERDAFFAELAEEEEVKETETAKSSPERGGGPLPEEDGKVAMSPGHGCTVRGTVHLPMVEGSAAAEIIAAAADHPVSDEASPPSAPNSS